MNGKEKNKLDSLNYLFLTNIERRAGGAKY